MKLVIDNDKDLVQRYIEEHGGDYSKMTDEKKDGLRIYLALKESAKHFEQTGQMRINLDGKTTYYTEEEARRMCARIAHAEAVRKGEI